MASSTALSDLLARVSFHFNQVRPMIPMYTHLVISAILPIYTGAHASLSRPSSAAKPDKKTKKHADTEEDEEDEDKMQKMEGLSNKDAIILPVTAGLVLTGLYFLIKKYGAEMINLIMGYYFAGVGVYSVAKLFNDAANIVVSFVFPTYFRRQGALWEVQGSKQKAVQVASGNGLRSSSHNHASLSPCQPARSNASESPAWSVRRFIRQKYTIKAFISNILELDLNATPVNILSAFVGTGTILYVNFVSKPWLLTNLQGFAVSYGALQLMSPTTFVTGSLILSALFFYDIWAVFFTPLMVTVAKNLDQPIKMVFPRPDEPNATPGEPPVRSFSMLGLGDIVVPGIMIGLALRFDLYMFYLKKQSKIRKAKAEASNDDEKSEEVVHKAPYVPPTGRWGDRFWTLGLPANVLPPQLKSSFPKPYFVAAVAGYVIGMLTTLGVMSIFHHAQPALLYLVPGVLISLWGRGLARGELKEMWEFSEAVTAEPLPEDDKKDQDDESEKGAKVADTRGLFERLWHEIWHGDDKEAKTESKGTDQKTAAVAKKSSKSIDSESKRAESKKAEDDMIFSFSFARHRPKASGIDSQKTKAEASKTGHQEDNVPASSASTASESSEDAVLVSSAETDGNVDTQVPTYRTRSTRSTRGKRSKVA